MFYEVILDSGETPNKCTVASLSQRPDFYMTRVKGDKTLGPLRSSILLHHQGVCLTSVQKPLHENFGISSIDCVWRRLDVLLNRIAQPLPVMAKIPDGFETAYPRSSKKYTDPSAGLATIEAIFIAAALLGTWDVSLLSHYYFGRQFIELNKYRFLELGVDQASETNPVDALPIFAQKPKYSFQRRLSRGKY